MIVFSSVLGTVDVDVGNPPLLCDLGLVQQKTAGNESRCGHEEFEAGQRMGTKGIQKLIDSR